VYSGHSVSRTQDAVVSLSADQVMLLAFVIWLSALSATEYSHPLQGCYVLKSAALLVCLPDDSHTKFCSLLINVSTGN